MMIQRLPDLTKWREIQKIKQHFPFYTVCKFSYTNNSSRSRRWSEFLTTVDTRQTHCVWFRRASRKQQMEETTRKSTGNAADCEAKRSGSIALKLVDASESEGVCKQRDTYLHPVHFTKSRRLAVLHNAMRLTVVLRRSFTIGSSHGRRTKGTDWPDHSYTTQFGIARTVTTN